MTRKIRHAHACHRCQDAIVWCISAPERDEDGAHCPGEAHPEQYACDDCGDLEMCEMCGKYLPRESLIEKDRTMMCPECVEGDGPDEEAEVVFDLAVSPSLESVGYPPM